MACIEVRNQNELDETLATKRVRDGADWVACVGDGRFTTRGNSRVTARDNSQVTARDDSRVTASKCVAGTKMTHDGWNRPCVKGGVVIEPPRIESVEDWIDGHGLNTSRGFVTVYKAVNDELRSERGCEFPVGKEVKFADSVADGNDLHFSQSPHHAKGHFNEATRFLACKVKVSEAALIGANKIKAPRCKVIEEVNLFDASPLLKGDGPDA